MMPLYDWLQTGRFNVSTSRGSNEKFHIQLPEPVSRCAKLRAGVKLGGFGLVKFFYTKTKKTDVIYYIVLYSHISSCLLICHQLSY